MKMGSDDFVHSVETLASGQALQNGADCSDDDNEATEEPPRFVRPRRGAVSTDPYKKGYYKEPYWNKFATWEQKLFSAIQTCSTLRTYTAEDHISFVKAMEVHKRYPGEYFYKEGEPGDSLLVILEGQVGCYRGDKLIATRSRGAVVDEAQILYSLPRTFSVMAREECIAGKFRREDFVDLNIRHEFARRGQRQFYLRNSKLLEMMSEEFIAKMVDVLEVRTYEAGSNIITQDEQGKELFILEKGEARVWKRMGQDDEQTYLHYYGGELFGEIALVKSVPRQANVTAESTCVVLALSRSQFERLLGPISQLHAQQYQTDPRKLIADFYELSDGRGPRGSLNIAKQTPEPEKHGASAWFAVYRPTSRDAIYKMLSGNAVGKGLNVKGKSAKQGILSGFVPFIQISDNKHKAVIEKSPPEARLRLYFKTKAAREEAKKALTTVLQEPGSTLDISDRRISISDDYEPSVYGLELPEGLIREAYIMRPDLSPIMGWETGRKSEPAYMDMNLHAVREKTLPTVVLYQNDESDPMNPRGLLIAYAEEFVKPVVSDFDTFTVGSKGMEYEHLIPDQSKLVTWALNHTEAILGSLDHNPWTTRWLEVLKKENENGFHPKFPKYGYGDPTSYRLTGDVVQQTAPCGAVRHGAECCNFYFPQELDDEYLVVWREFPDKPWEYKTEEQLRKWLMERIPEGYAFNLNPVWAVRDPGWYDVFTALKKSQSATQPLSAWYPKESKILDKVENMHKVYPSGFKIVDSLKK
mmetsp:Transcript_35599/g.80414  ORF Transcript_35599/g.80414 Transcript_35599/m.80414 type:complete len:755 (-) Transcript_35599:285-2549(-)